MKQTARKRESGITLIEVLVTIATIALLAGLLFPQLTAGMRFARRINCLHHLKQWGLATQSFALENDDYLPLDGAPNGRSRAAGWYIDLPKQLGIEPYHQATWRTNADQTLPRSVWLCPANRRRSNGHNLFHYCLNQHINGSGSGKQIRLSAVPTPHAAIWLFDNGGLAAVAQQNNIATEVHGRGANFLFLDGHVTHYPVAAYWDTTREIGRTDHPELRWRPGAESTPQGR